MISKKNVKTVGKINYESVDTIVGSEVTFIGDITSAGSIRYEGNFKGNINVGGSLVVGRNSFIVGDVKANTVHIIGAVEGPVVCENLKIFSTGKLTGDAYVDNIIIDEGAIFIGNCKIKALSQDSEDTSSINDVLNHIED